MKKLIDILKIEVKKAFLSRHERLLESFGELAEKYLL